MEKVNISVIIPVYNAESTIERCVESLENNKFDCMEVILVNDCSKDDSLNVCQSLAEKYNNIFVYSNEINRGVSHTRNVGLKYARGKYLIFVDSDDYVEDNYIKELFELKNNIDKAFVVCGYYIVDMKYNKTIDTIVYSNNEIDTLDNSKIEKMYEDTLLQQLWNKIFERKIISDNNITFDEGLSIGEDTKFILEYLKYSNFEKIIMINKPLYYYLRDQSTSLMHNVNYTHYKSSLENLANLHRLLGKSDEEINCLLSDKNTSGIYHYAYMILNNKNMTFIEKKKNIYNLDKKEGKTVFKEILVLYIKERIRKFI